MQMPGIDEFTGRNITSVLLACILVATMAAPQLSGSVSSSASAAQAAPSNDVCGARLAGGKKPAGGVTPVLFVHGLNSGAQMWTGGTIKTQGRTVKQATPKVQGKNKMLVELVSGVGSTAALVFDYRASSTKWVTDDEIGDRLADTISCLRDETKGRKVVVVAHSMGGLAAQWAASKDGGDVGGNISAVVTLGTPYKGSWAAECAIKENKNRLLCGLLDVIVDVCDGREPPRGRKIDPAREWGLVPNSPLCAEVPNPEIKDTQAVKALANRRSEIDKLPGWPDGGPRIHRIAGEVVRIAKDFGDTTVSTESATGGDRAAPVARCSEERALTCLHHNLHTSAKVADVVMQTVKQFSPPSKPPPVKTVDWRNRTYSLTCDDTVDDSVKVAVRNGKAIVRGDGIGVYDRWEVAVQRTAHGKLSSLGNVTAVLFYCSPQPSNFFTQELRIYRSSNGKEIARIPHLSGGEWLPPEYQPESVSIRQDRIVAALRFYGPGDPHGSPSRLRHLSWTWDGRKFVTHGDSEAPGRIDLSRERITVNGIGPLKLGMSPEEAEGAIGAAIPVESSGPTCVDHTVEGGPTGLFLRFAQHRLVAIGVRPPAKEIYTASGIHIGSARDAVMNTYAGEIEATTSVHGNEELVFAPTAPEFAGRVIVFGIVDGAVGLFIAGERDWATLSGPCGGD